MYNWPYPAVQRGGMSAVAIATPGIGLPFYWCMAITTANQKIRIYQILGEVLDNTGCASLNGLHKNIW
jgi:hypothetical protein